jgi:hypothetical protein
MKKQNQTKLKKKQIESDLIEAIEKSLSTENNDSKVIGKVRKTIKKSVEKITRTFLKNVKKENNSLNQSKEDVPLALNKRNKNLTKKLKGKPNKENVKEIIKL